MEVHRHPPSAHAPHALGRAAEASLATRLGSVRARYALAVALAIVGAFLVAVLPYWVPASEGTDENAYLVAGRNLALRGTPAIVAAEPQEFVGRMWIKAPDGRFFPKYPLGLPLLVALVCKLAGAGHAVTAAYLISPLAMAAALLGIFALGSEIADAETALLAELLAACSPLTLDLANDAGSHALDLAVVTWGVVLLVRWMDRGGAGLAAGAGALLGFSTIVRYSDVLLALPVAVAIWQRRRAPRLAREAGLLGLVGMAPLVAQLAYNRRALGAWTGYAATAESTAFAWRHFADNWQGTLLQLSEFALPATLVFAVLGLAWPGVLRRGAPTMLLAWLLPSSVLYMAYYYGVENADISYTRFFLVVLPPLVLGAACALVRIASKGISLRLAVALVVAFGALQGLGTAAHLLGDDRDEAEEAKAAERSVLRSVPAGSVVFGPWEVLNHLQFVGDLRLYGTDEFNRQALGQLENGSAPDAEQPERVRALADLLRDKSDREIELLQRSLATQALANAERVFVVAPPAGPADSRSRVPTLGSADDGRVLSELEVAHWADPRSRHGLRVWHLTEIVEARAAP